MDYRLALMTGIDIPIEEFQVNIHQPTIKEISYIGEEGFFSALQYLTLDKTNYIKDQTIQKQVSDFQIFTTLMNQKDLSEQRKEVNNLLTLLFPECKIFLTPQSIILQKKDGTLVIDDNNFQTLQEIIKIIFCLKTSLGQQHGFNPTDSKAQKIAEKIMEGRKKISQEKGEDRQSVFSRYLSILAIGNKQSLLDLRNLTVYQINDQVERYSMYVNWDIDIRSRLAGATGTEKLEDWMKNIH